MKKYICKELNEIIETTAENKQDAIYKIIATTSTKKMNNIRMEIANKYNMCLYDFFKKYMKKEIICKK